MRSTTPLTDTGAQSLIANWTELRGAGHQQSIFPIILWNGWKAGVERQSFRRAFHGKGCLFYLYSAARPSNI